MTESLIEQLEMLMDVGEVAELIFSIIKQAQEI